MSNKKHNFEKIFDSHFVKMGLRKGEEPKEEEKKEPE
jgi:hypothetical protein